jgi:hypothetical protein
VFNRIEVCDRKLVNISYQAPFDLLFSTGKFEYGQLVAPTGFEPALPPERDQALDDALAC